jgi:hypothetical protein
LRAGLIAVAAFAHDFGRGCNQNVVAFTSLRDLSRGQSATAYEFRLLVRRQILPNRYVHF